jgi:hypothetical protein
MHHFGRRSCRIYPARFLSAQTSPYHRRRDRSIFYATDPTARGSTIASIVMYLYAYALHCTLDSISSPSNSVLIKTPISKTAPIQATCKTHVWPIDGSAQWLTNQRSLLGHIPVRTGAVTGRRCAIPAINSSAYSGTCIFHNMNENVFHGSSSNGEHNLWRLWCQVLSCLQL